MNGRRAKKLKKDARKELRNLIADLPNLPYGARVRIARRIINLPWWAGYLKLILTTATIGLALIGLYWILFNSFNSLFR